MYIITTFKNWMYVYTTSAPNNISKTPLNYSLRVAGNSVHFYGLYRQIVIVPGPKTHYEGV